MTTYDDIKEVVILIVIGFVYKVIRLAKSCLENLTFVYRFFLSWISNKKNEADELQL